MPARLSAVIGLLVPAHNLDGPPMRRKPKGRPHFDWTEYSVRTDVDREQLELIGAICLEWNFIEDMIDFTLFHAWEMDRDASIETSSRIYGIDGKLAIIKQCVRVVKRHPEPSPSVIATTIDAVAEHKTFRDGVMHARLLDPKSDVAPTSIWRGRADEVLVSKEALDGLLARLEIISLEMVAVLNALAYTFINDNDEYDPKPGSPLRQFQAYIVQVQEHQKRRLALPPLPKFPPGPPAPPKTEEPK